MLRYAVRVRSLLVPCCVALVSFTACGCGGGDASMDAAVDAGPCVPTTCEAAAAECGSLDDGCGGVLACGDCALGEACGFAQPHRCGGECSSDADCDRGEVCDLGGARCTTGCRTGPFLAVDLPHHPVTVEITLDGEPLPATVEGATPALRIVPTATAGDRSSGYELHPYERADGSTTRRERLEINLPPGDYEVWYFLVSGDPAAPFPWAEHTRLTELRVEPDDAIVTLDIPVAHVTLRPRLSSAPLPEAGAGGSNPPRLHIGHSTFVSLYDEAGSPRPAITVPVVAGAPFTVRYYGSVDDAFADFPRNTFSPLHESVAVEGSVIDLDIDAVRVALELRFDGSPAEPGTHHLHLSRDGERGMLVELTDPASTEVTLRPGTYGLDYRGFGGGIRGQELVATTDGRQVLDFPTTLATFRVTTGDGPHPSCPGSAFIWVGGTRIDLGPSDEETLVTARVLEGEHGPRFEPGVPCDEGESGWPMDAAELPAVQIRGEAPVVSLFVPRHSLTLAVTLDGDPPPALAAASGGLPYIRVRPSVPDTAIGHVYVPLYREAGDALVPVTARTLWLHGRDYDLLYQGARGDYETAWPVGARRLVTALHPATRPTAYVDVPRVRSRLAVTMGGRRLPALRAPDAWFRTGPTIRLTASEAEASQLGFFSSDGVPHAPRDRWHLPGRYRLTFDYHYSENGFFGRTTLYARSGLPPLGIPLGCWEAR